MIQEYSTEEKAQEAFAKIIIYIAQQLDRVNDHIEEASQSDSYDTLPRTLQELALAFRETGGFSYTKEQALPLSYAFEVIAQSCQNFLRISEQLSSQAVSQTFRWAGVQAKEISQHLEDAHKRNQGGMISFDPNMSDKIVQWSGGTVQGEVGDRVLNNKGKKDDM